MFTLIEALKALAFGIVEGITEWLPISSTGHMMLLQQFLPLDVSASFYDVFLVVIQLGAIMAVIILYFQKLNPFSRKKTPAQRRSTWGIWAKVVVGSIPAGIVGLLLDNWMEENVMNNDQISYLVVSLALIVYGIIFIVMEHVNRKRIAEAQAAPRGKHAAPAHAAKDFKWEADPEGEDASNAIAKVRNFDELSFGKAFAIGIFQSLAIIPGTSRSGSIIIGSMLLGTSRTVATEFAFFLAIPIMLGWSLLKFIKHGFAYTGTEWMVFGIGIVTAFVVSILSIKFLIGYIKRNDFTAFGVYRIIVGIAMIGVFGVALGKLFM
jgi:undecaprenyl-diphosphatase